jgi:hypothetical protein
MFDIGAFVSAFLGSSLVVGAAGYVLKRYFDSQFVVLEQRQKASIEEEFRRKAALFDEQVVPLKMVVTVTYQLRNEIRALLTIAENSGLSVEDATSRIESIRNTIDNAQILARAQRAILPEVIFNKFHKAIGLTHSVLYEVESNRKGGNRRLTQQNLGGAMMLYQTVDHAYQDIVEAVQYFLGVDADSGNSATASPPDKQPAKQ